MNTQSFTLAERLIPATYLQQAAASKRTRENLIRTLIEHVSNLLGTNPSVGRSLSKHCLFLNEVANILNFPRAEADQKIVI